MEEGGKKTEERRKKRKIKSRSELLRNDRKLKMRENSHTLGNPANMHLGEKRLLCIVMTLICWKDSALEGRREEQTVGTKGCSDLFLS